MFEVRCWEDAEWEWVILRVFACYSFAQFCYFNTQATPNRHLVIPCWSVEELSFAKADFENLSWIVRSFKFGFGGCGSMHTSGFSPISCADFLIIALFYLPLICNWKKPQVWEIFDVAKSESPFFYFFHLSMNVCQMLSVNILCQNCRSRIKTITEKML